MKKSIFLLIMLLAMSSIAFAGPAVNSVRTPAGVSTGDNMKLRGYLALTSVVVSPSALTTTTAATTLQLGSTYNVTVIDSFATLGTLAIVMPSTANIVDGFQATIAFIPAVTTMTITASGSTVKTQATSASALTSLRFMYNKLKNIWYRI